GRVEHGSVGADPGIVHEDVDLAVGVERLLYDLLDLLFIRDVTFDEDRIAPVTPNLIGSLTADVLAPIHDHDLAALASEDLAHTLAVPPACAGDDRDPVF